MSLNDGRPWAKSEKGVRHKNFLDREPWDHGLNGTSEKKKIKDMFNQNRIDAGIFVGFPNSCELIEELVARGFVIGVFNQYRPDKTEPNRVVVRLDYTR